MEHPDLLEGFDQFSDAGVFRLEEDLVIAQTVDFFPYGQNIRTLDIEVV